MESKTKNNLKMEIFHLICIFFLFFVISFVHVIIREYGGVIMNKTLSGAYGATAIYFTGYGIYRMMKFIHADLTGG